MLICFYASKTASAGICCSAAAVAVAVVAAAAATDAVEAAVLRAVYKQIMQFY
jgi:hypothetical protein